MCAGLKHYAVRRRLTRHCDPNLSDKNKRTADPHDGLPLSNGTTCSHGVKASEQQTQAAAAAAEDHTSTLCCQRRRCGAEDPLLAAG